MAVDIYAELLALGSRLTAAEAKAAALEARVLKLETPPPTLRLAVISYFRSSTLWASTLAAKPAFCCINPGSGPGPSADALYVAQVPKNKAAGVPTLGYVHSKGAGGYGTRPLAEIKADVLNHIAWYGVDGIFVDTVSVDPAFVPYYADLCAFIKSKGLKVCLNPGTRCLEDHAKMADWVMCAETYASTYLAAPARPAWEKNYPGKMLHCVHTCTASQVPAVVSKAKADGAGLLYVTDDLMPNPYDTLPTYLPALLDEIKK